MRRVLAAFVGLAVFTGGANAQAPRGAIAGLVRDSASGGPTAFARVRLLEYHREVTTHEDGRFRFAEVPEGPVTLIVQRIGFAGQTVRGTVVAAAPLAVTVTLVRSAMQLATAVVTGAVDERASVDALNPTTVVSGAALDRRLEATVSATLAGTPGFTATSMGPATARPVLRGLSGDRVLVLEDGLRPGDMSAMSADHATAIEPASAKQIEVVRGPMSLLYGSSALGGVVNVVQDVVPTSLPDDAHGAITVQGSSAQPGGSVTGVLSTRLGTTAVRVEGSSRQAGDLRTPEGTMGNTRLSTHGLAIGASRVGPDGHVGVAVRGYVSTYGLPGGFTGAHPNGVDIEMRRVSVRGDAERHVAIGPFTSIRSNAQYTFYAHDELGAPGRVTVSYQQQLAALEGVARHGAWGLASSGAVGMRAQLRQINVGGANRATDTRDLSLAGFAVQEYGTGMVRGQAGVRYDVASYTPLDPRRTVEVGGAFVPVRNRQFAAASASMGAFVQPVDGLRVGASVGRAFRTPDFNELYSDGPHLAAYSYDVGNPGIRQETGLGADLFVRVDRGPLQAEVSAYRNTLTDFIFAENTGETGRQGFAPKFQYRNAAARFTGMEGAVTLSLGASWVLEGTASYVSGERTDVTLRDSVPTVRTPTDSFPAGPASRWLPWVPPLQGSVGARWESSRFFAGVTVRAAAAQDRTGDFERATDGYRVLNLSIGTRLLIGAQLHTITVRLDNAGNTLYRDHLARTKVVLPEVGRNLSVLYRLAF